MAETTKIEWTDATVNFWWGCTKVGPGCDHCYAETWSARFGGNHWGVGAPRRKIKGAAAMLNRLDNDYAWWAADAEIGGYHPNSRRRVFIQSMSDLFDTEVPLAWFAEAWGKIVQCDRLDIQIVTKRISVVEKRLAAIGATTWPKHAGLLVTVCNQAEANRDIPRLLALKGKLGIPWVGVSAEPLLGPIDFAVAWHGESALDSECWGDCAWCESGHPPLHNCQRGRGDWERGHSGLDWVIVGGESGPNARPMHPDWARSIRDQCAAAGTPFFFKQWGAWASLPAAPKIEEAGGRTCSVAWPDGTIGPGSASEHGGPGTVLYVATKKLAGRLLDGVTHDGMPEAPHG